LPEEIRATMKMEDVIYGYYSLPIEIAGEGGPEVVEPAVPPETEMVPEEDQAPPGRNPYRNFN